MDEIINVEFKRPRPSRCPWCGTKGRITKGLRAGAYLCGYMDNSEEQCPEIEWINRTYDDCYELSEDGVYRLDSGRARHG